MQNYIHDYLKWNCNTFIMISQYISCKSLKDLYLNRDYW